MSPQPHEGPAEEGLSSSLLQIVHDPERIDRLRNSLSGFCHRCRNSLNGVRMSLYLLRREARGAVPECLDELETIYQQVVNLFDHLQIIYRSMAITMVRSPLDDLIDHEVPKWRSWYESRGLALEVDAPESAVLGDFDPALLGMGLDALAAWRAESGLPGTLTRIAWTAGDGTIDLCWEEVVPRLPADRPEFAGRIEPRAGNPDRRRVDLLELPLLARIVAEHGGRIHYSRGPGFRLRLRWPQFRQADPQGEA